MNLFLSSGLNYKNGLKKANIIYCSNDETIETISQRLGKRRSFEKRIELLIELGVSEDYLEKRKHISHVGGTVHVLVSGRLMYRKGIMLLLDALPLIDTKVPFVVDIWGMESKKMNYG